MTTRRSSQQPFSLYIFFGWASWPIPLYLFFLLEPSQMSLYLFLGCGHCIFFCEFPVKGKHSIQSTSTGILVLSRLGYVGVSFFSAGPAEQSHCIFLFRLGQLADAIVSFFFDLTRLARAIVYFFFGPTKKERYNEKKEKDTTGCPVV